MAPHSSILAWRIPWTEEAGGLQSMRSQSRTQLSAQHTNAIRKRNALLNLNEEETHLEWLQHRRGSLF